MNNFSIAQSATTTAINSTGSSMKEQEKYANSLEARINRLDTAWNKFTLSAGKAILTDGLVSGIESLNSLASGASKVIDKIGILSGVFGILGVATFALSTKFKTFTTSLIFGTQGMTRAQLATTGLSAGMTRLGIATVGVKTALRGLLASTVVGAVFVGIGFAIEKMISAYSDAKQAQEKFNQQQQTSVDALTTNKEQTEALIQQYKELSDQREKMGGSLGVDGEQKYLAVQQQLAELYPQLIDYIDGAGNKHLKSKEAIDQEIEATNKLIEAKKLEIQANAKKDIKEAMGNRNKIQGNITKTKNDIESPIEVVGSGKTQIFKKKSEDDIKLLQSQLLSYEAQWSSASQVITSKVLTIADSYTKLKIDPSIGSSVDKFVSSLDTSKLDENQLEGLAVRIGKVKDELQQAYKDGDKKGFDNAQKSLVEYVNSIGDLEKGSSDLKLSFDGIKKAAELGATATFAGRDGMDGLDESTQGAIESTDNFTNILSMSTDEIIKNSIAMKDNVSDTDSNTDSKYKNMSAAEMLVGMKQDDIDKTSEMAQVYNVLSKQENLSESQKYALATATQFLAKTYPNLVKGQDLNIKGMLEEAKTNNILIKAVEASANGQLTAQQQATLGTGLSIKTRIDNMKAEILSIKNVIAAYGTLADASMDEIARQMNAGLLAPDVGAQLLGAKGSIKYYESEIDSLANSLKGVTLNLSKIPSISSQLDKDTNSTKKNTKAQKDNNKETQQSTYVTDKFKQKMEELNLAIEKQKNIQSKYPTWSKQYQNSIKEEIKLLEQKKKAIDNEAISLDKQIKSGKVIKKGEVVSESRTSGGDKPSTIKSNRKLSGWSGTVTQEKTNGHRGYDIDGKIGDRLDANVNGKVTFAGRGKGSAASYGNVIYVVDSSGKQHRYAHLNKVSVSVGDIVKIGQKIGEIGNTGNTSKGRSGDGSHLHYEVLDKNGKLLNPSSYVNASRGKKITTVTPTSSKPVSNSARIWDFLKSKGFSDSAAAGVLGNIQQESSFNTGAVNPKTGAYGIGQWLGSRLTNLKKYAKSKGKSYKDLNVQMEYLYKELSGADSTTKSKLKKYGGLSGLKKMNVSDAVKAFENAFERSGGDSMSKRQKYAKSNYDKYKGTSSKDRANQAKDVDDATSTLNDLKGQSLQTTQEIQDLYKQLIDAVVSGFEKQQSDLDIDLEKSQLRMSRLVEGSAGYTKELDKQKKILQDKQKVNKDEIDYLKKQNDLRVLSSSTIKKNEAEIKSLEKKNKAYKLNAKEREQNEKKINSLEKSNDKKEKRVTTLKKENKDKHTSAKERKANQKEIDKLNKEIKKNNSTIDKLENANKLKKLSSSEIKKNQVRIDALKKANNSRVLSVATRAENDKIIKELQKGNEDLINQLQELEFQKVQSIIKAFDDAVDKINDKISLSKAKMDSYKEGSSGYFSELKKQIGYTVDEVEQYKKKVAGLQKQLKNKSLTPAQLEELKKQLAEANIQLQETKNSLQDLQQSYKDIISDTLTKQKEANIQHLQDGFDKLNKQLDELIKKDESFDFGNFADSIDDVINSLDELDGHFTSNAFFETSTWDVRSLISDTKKKITDLDTSVKKLANSTSASQSGLEGIIRSESELANQIYDQIKDIDNQIRDTQLLYKQQEDALQNQIDLKQEQLDQLDEQYQKEDRIKAFQDLMDERNKVMADKRFITIDASGKETLTYDKAKADDLNKQIDEMNTNNAREDAKKALQDQINIMQKDLDKTKQIHQASLQAMQLYRDGLQGEYDALITDIGNKKDELKELQDKQIEDTTKQWDDLIKAVTDGTMTYDQLMKTWYASTIADMKQYNADVASELATLKQSLSDLLATQEAIKNAKSSSSSSSSSNSSSGSSKTNTTTTSKTIKSYDVIVYDPKTKKNTTTNTKTLADANKIVAKYKANVVDVVPKYHEGGIVGDIPTGNSKIANLVNKLFNVKSNEQLSLLKKGEVVINPSLPNVQRNFNNILNAMIPNVPTVVQSGDTIHLNIEKVVTNDASTFLPDLQRIISTRKS